MGLGIQRAKRTALLLRIVTQAIALREAEKEAAKRDTPTNLAAAKTAEHALDDLLKEWDGFQIGQRRRRGESTRQIVLDLRGGSDDHSH